jgi:hypothetical protein
MAALNISGIENFSPCGPCVRACMYVCMYGKHGEIHAFVWMRVDMCMYAHTYVYAYQEPCLFFKMVGIMYRMHIHTYMGVLCLHTYMGVSGDSLVYQDGDNHGWNQFTAAKYYLQHNTWMRWKWDAVDYNDL